MNENEFKNLKYGKLFWNQKGMYYNFEPNKLPFKFEETNELKSLLVETAINLGRLDGLTGKFSKKEIDLILIPFLIREAKLSSEIEGTRSTLSDVYKSDKEKEKDRTKALDNEEVKNYLKAINFGIEELKHNSFSEEFIKKLHKILLQGVRGENKNPGKYKEFQNAIGKQGDNLDTAKFVPASPETTQKLMKNLVEHLTNKEINPLYTIALIHYQFETIHPFQDGNGRIGRLLIMLYLSWRGVLKLPMIYVSEYFNKHRTNYTKFLYEVSAKNNMLEWIKFFLNALNEQAKKSFEFSLKLDAYKKELKSNLQKTSKSVKILSVINMLFVNPYIKINDVVKEIGITHSAANKLIKFLVSKKILEEVSGRKRNQIFLAKKILEILEI